MTLDTVTEILPFQTDENGVVRVGDTRITLETVINTFLQGATAEEIVQKYPSLDLADVYYVIGYYLRHRSQIEEYLQQRKDVRESVRKENETRFENKGIRERLLARQARKGS